MATLTAYQQPPSSLSSPHAIHSCHPPNPHQQLADPTCQQPSWKSHSVNRTNELLSCARTAFKIAQQKRRQYDQNQQTRNAQNGHGHTSVWINKGGETEGDLIPEWMLQLNPNDLTLYVPPPPSFAHENNNNANNNNNTQQLLQDSLSLLSILDTHLADLHSLVRRRGHTNDPTLEIQSLLEKFQSVSVELKEGISSLRLAGTIPIYNEYTNENVKSSVQRRRHYELLSDRLENDAKDRMDRLKKELETRSQVLRDQNFHRRKLLGTAGGGSNASKSGIGGGVSGVGNGGGASTGVRRGTATSSGGYGGGGVARINALPAKSAIGAKSATQQFQSPLFTMTANATSASSAPSASAPSSLNNRSSSSSANSPAYSSGNANKSSYSGYAGYGGATAPAGYGGTTTPSFSTGMRQRKQQPSHSANSKSSLQIDHGHDDDNDNNKYSKSSSYDESNTSIQQQIQQRRQNRETQSRLASARLAEKSIAELGVMFTKMSTLISQQGEVLERIEDDVERAGGDIDAGHDEIVKLYGMTKGNRGLILKVFGILIFFIVFMKLY